MISGNASYNFVVPERLRTLRHDIFTVGVGKETCILRYHPYKHCTAGRFSLQNMLDYAILNLPLQKRQVLSAQRGGLASSGKLPGAVKPYCLVPPDANAKGGMPHDTG